MSLLNENIKKLNYNIRIIQTLQNFSPNFEQEKLTKQKLSSNFRKFLRSKNYALWSPCKVFKVMCPRSCTLCRAKWFRTLWCAVGTNIQGYIPYSAIIWYFWSISNILFPLLWFYNQNNFHAISINLTSNDLICSISPFSYPCYHSCCCCSSNNNNTSSNDDHQNCWSHHTCIIHRWLWTFNRIWPQVYFFYLWQLTFEMKV